MSKDDPMSRLADLTRTGAPPEDKLEEKLSSDIAAILDHAEQLAGDNIFDMQILIEAAAEELREQIRTSGSENDE